MTARRQGALAALVVFLALVGRLLWMGHTELQAGEAALAARDSERAIRHFRRAAHAYLPGSPYVSAAYDHLEAEARAAETRGQLASAAEAWRAVRASALGTRWMVVPQRERLDRANRHLAHLMALSTPPPEERDLPVSTREERHLALLLDDRSPDPAWVFVTGAGLLLWIGAGFWAVRHGWDDAHRPQRRALGRAAVAVAVGVGLFVLGLWRA